MSGAKRTSTAYHEAGHAVARYCVRRPFLEVTIEPDSDTAGRLRVMMAPADPVRFRASFHGNHDAWIADQVVAIMAGHVAQAAFELGRDILQDPKLVGLRYLVDVAWQHAEGDGSDGDQIARLLPMHSGMPYSDPLTDESRDGLREGLLSETVRLIDKEWPAAEAVARALLERRTLSQAEVWAIVAATDPAEGVSL